MSLTKRYAESIGFFDRDEDYPCDVPYLERLAYIRGDKESEVLTDRDPMDEQPEPKPRDIAHKTK